MVDNGGLTAQDLTTRGHSLRNFDPEDFREVANGQGKREAREALEFVESGRFEPVLAATQRMFRALDGDERRQFAKENPGLMRWVNVWGFLEDVGEFDLPATRSESGQSPNGGRSSVECSLTAKGREFAAEAAERVIDGGVSPQFWRDRGLEVIGKGESRLAVAPISDQGNELIRGDCILKFEKDEQPAQNATEIDNWQKAPPGVRKVLAPVVDHGSEGQWLLMPRADATATPVDLITVENTLEEQEWRCRGLHTENIGVFDGQPKAFDYGFTCTEIK